MDCRVKPGNDSGKGCRIRLGPDSGLAMTPEGILARLLYRDGLLLVIDKGGGGRPRRRRGPHRDPARQARRNARLVDEARPAWPAGGDDLEGDGAWAGPYLARARAAGPGGGATSSA